MRHIILSWHSLRMLFAALALATVSSSALADDVAPPSPQTARVATSTRNARPAPARTEAPAARAGSSPDGVVNINTANADELMRLSGIGPSRAEAILALRQRMNRFARVEDLLRVRGIGRATLRRMRPSLAIDGPTTLVQAPRSRRSPAAAAPAMPAPPSSPEDEEL